MRTWRKEVKKLVTQLLGKTPHRARSKCRGLRWEGAAMSEEGKGESGTERG